jgi:hypothetical protein
MSDIKKESRWFPKLLEDNVEKIFRTIFFWENDPKRIGIFIRFVHHSFIYICLIWYILVHTFMNSYLLFLLFYLVIGIIWIQHCIIGGCLLNRIECKLIGDTKSFVDPILETFHIPITSESTDGFILLGSTTIMFILTCELISRSIINIRNWFSI